MTYFKHLIRISFAVAAVVRGKRVDLGAYEYNVRSGTLMFLR